MTEGHLKTISIAGAAGGASCFDVLDLPTSLAPLKKGDKPKLANTITVKNTGTVASYLTCYIFESNSVRSCTKAIWTGITSEVNPGSTYTWNNVFADYGVDKDYPAGSTLYLCFKTWCPASEDSWTCCPEKACASSTITVAATNKGIEPAYIALGIGTAVAIGIGLAAYATLEKST